MRVAAQAGTVELWDLSGSEPVYVARLYEAAPERGLVVTAEGYVDGPADVLAGLRFADGWAIHKLADLPEHQDPERVRRALAPLSGGGPA